MGKRNQQLNFQLLGFEKPSDRFGGSLLKGNPKRRRPLDSRFPIHLVMRANESRMRRPHTFLKVNQKVQQVARKHGVRIYQYANVGNHLHLLIKLRAIRNWSAFIRELAGQIAQSACGQQTLKMKFWKFRPFTRIIRSWRKGFQSVKQYVQLNVLEAEGFISRQEIKTLSDLRRIWSETG